MTPLHLQKRPSPDSTLKTVRTARQLSQVELARLAGVHPATVSLAERSGRVSEYLAVRLAGVLGIAAGELLR